MITKHVCSVLPRHFDSVRSHLSKCVCELAYIVVGIIFTERCDEKSDWLMSAGGRETIFYRVISGPKVPGPQSVHFWLQLLLYLLVCVWRRPCQQKAFQNCSIQMAPKRGSASLLQTMHGSRVWHLDRSHPAFDTKVDSRKYRKLHSTVCTVQRDHGNVHLLMTLGRRSTLTKVSPSILRYS